MGSYRFRRNRRRKERYGKGVFVLVDIRINDIVGWKFRYRERDMGSYKNKICWC